MEPHCAAAIIVSLLLIFLSTVSTAQTYYCLPTCDPSDGRFLSLSGSSFQSVAGDQITINLATAGAVDSISFEIFDGETSGVWDGGTAPLAFTLLTDANGDGVGEERVGRWFGNTMADSAWHRIALVHAPSALAESGAYFYVLRVEISSGDTSDFLDIEDDAEDFVASITRSSFKIRSTANMSAKQFAFSAPLFSTREARIVYPVYPLLSAPTYDGTWSLFVNIPEARASFEVWDGDMDYGSWDGLAIDTDDGNTSSNPTWSGSNARAEGAATGTDYIRTSPGTITNVLGSGSPADDNLSLAYRRSPSVYYEVVDPNGVTYRNNNPSGNLEWERFVIGKQTETSLDTTATYLPRGVYEVRISGMDMHNMNAWRHADGILGVSSTGTIAPMPDAVCPTTERVFGRGASSVASAEIAVNGELFTWGGNANGQLGDGSTTDRDVPVAVLKGDYPGTTYLGDACGGVTSVGTGAAAMIAALHDGSVYAWGANASNLLGVNSVTTTISEPKRVVKGAYAGTTYLGDSWTNPIVNVAAGNRHMVALAASGGVYTWGRNDKGQCGDGSTTNRTSPVRVLKGAYSGTTYLGDNPANPIVDIAAGDSATYALAADGTVYAWGHNNTGQLGDGTTTNRSTPVRVLKGAYSGTTYLGDATGDRMTSIAAMSQGCIALATSGLVYAWGRNTDGQLGDNSTTQRTTPVRVLKGAYAGATYLGDSTTNKIVQIVAGASHCIALSARGQAFAWGDNNGGVLGDNSTTDRSTPVRVLRGEYSGPTHLGDGDAAVTSIGAGAAHSLALTASTSLSYAWGVGTLGRLGEAATTDRHTPVEVAQGARETARDDGNPDDGVRPSNPPRDDEAITIADVVVSPEADVLVLTLHADADSETTVTFFDADGTLVGPAVHNAVAAGVHRVAISLANDMPSGLYFVNLAYGGRSVARQFLITR